jgi:cbb3-type cytochrome oxidase subunit 3
VLLMTIFFLAAFVRATRRAARTRLREAAITEA